MTGCYPKRIGMHENEKGNWVLFPGNQRGISQDELTIAELLKSQGYATTIVGKWHLGDQPEFLPTRHGFDSYFGIPFSNDMGKMDRAYKGYKPLPLMRNEDVIEMEPNQRLITRRYTEEAVKFIEDNRDEPFFLYLPHSMPHWPQYSSRNFAHQSTNKAWGDSVEEIDWSTGVIMEKLKELNIDEHTMVIFTSDNGGALQHGASNTPLRDGKGTTWEGGQRVCCVARWPQHIKAGSACDQLTVSFDLFPTIAKLAGAEVPQERKIDGRDLGGLLFGDSQESPHEFFLYYSRGHLDAVRHGDWKLFVNRQRLGRNESFDGPELYHLVDDIGESNNVASQHPEVVERLLGYVNDARKDLGDGEKFAGANVREPGFVEAATTLTVDAPGELVQTDVFVAGEDGYHTYRIPSLITTPNGTLLATCEGRKDGSSDHGNLDLVMKRSEDLGQTWSQMQVIYEEGGDEKITIGNPCPVVDQETGIIWMPFCRNNNEVFMTHSKDDGLNWSTPVEITQDVKQDGWGWYATGPGVGIQMTRGKYNGRLVIPCDHREQKDGKWIKLSHVFYSDDHGQSWQLGGTVGEHTDECQVVELHDGRLLINMRNYWAADGQNQELGGKRSTAISRDGGETWQEFDFDETLIEPICQASLIKHSDDAFARQPLFFSNPASTSSRSQMTVRMSKDQGQTWPIARQFSSAPAAYSCLTVLPDRSIGCLYETGTENPYEVLRFARFTIPWLQQSSKE